MRRALLTSLRGIALGLCVVTVMSSNGSAGSSPVTNPDQTPASSRTAPGTQGNEQQGQQQSGTQASQQQSGTPGSQQQGQQPGGTQGNQQQGGAPGNQQQGGTQDTRQQGGTRSEQNAGRTDPFSDAWQFLIGQTKDQKALGSWRYLFVGLFWMLLIASFVVALWNWREDPRQRTATHASTCFVRVLIGCMWFQALYWKLPLFSETNGLHFWMQQMQERAAFQVHRELVKNVFLPNFAVFNVLVFLAELGFAVSLILGVGVRLVASVAIIFVLHLWLGIYDEGEIEEWPWSYIFLAALMFMLALHGAGRSLGFDAWLRRRSGTAGRNRPLDMVT